MRTAFFSLCLLFHAPLGLAALYFVNPAAPGAADTNDGQASVVTSNGHGPWSSLDRAMDVATAGDTVMIGTWDYREQNDYHQVMGSGQPGAELIFRAMEGARPLVQTIAVDGGSHIRIQGLRFEGGLRLPAGWEDMQGSRAVTDPAALDVYHSIITALTGDGPHTWQAGVELKNSTDVVVEDCEFSHLWSGVVTNGGCERITLRDSRAHHCALGFYTSQSALVGGLIRGNHFYQIFTDAVDVRHGSSGVIVEDNLCEYSGLGHIALHSGARDSIIRNNHCHHGGYYTKTMDFPGSSAINVHMAGENNVVDSNLAAYQLDAQYDEENGYWDGNGIILDIMEGVAVRVQNNICWRNMGSGITTTHSPNAIITNNLLAENGHGRTPEMQAFDATNGAGMRASQATDTGHIITNNIFYNNRVAGIYTQGLLGQMADVDANLYDQTSVGVAIKNAWAGGEGEYTDLAEVRAAFGFETRGIQGAARLRAAPDFRLLSDSPAIDAAIVDLAPAADRDALRRDLAPDIGPYEWFGCSSSARRIDALNLRDGQRDFQSETRLEFGGEVHLWAGADLRLSAPSVSLEPGLRVDAGACVTIVADRPTCAALPSPR